MKTELIQEYKKARQFKPFMVEGQDAKCSLDVARTVLAFREAEKAGTVRIRAEAEEENYFDVYGEPDTPREREKIVDQICCLGCWWIVTEKWEYCESCQRGGWVQMDSKGMCIYDNPCDPYENCYVTDLMQSALN